MNKTRSKAPLVLGIIGGVLGILEGSCIAICGKAAEEAGVGNTWFLAGILALVGAIAGLVGGCCARSQKWGSLVELIGGIIAAVSLVFTFDLMVLAAAVLLIVGGAVGLGKKAQ